MATNYPGSIDSLTNPSAGDALTSPSHSAQHANANDAIEAIETELGVNPSGSDATVAARLSAIEAGTNLATGAVTSAKIADDTITAGQIAANAVGSSELADNAVDTAAIQDGAVTAAKLAVQPGNLLTANQASMATTGLLTLDSCTEGAAGVYTASGSGTAFGYILPVAATAGETYTAFSTLATVGRTANIRIEWLNSGGSIISYVSGNSVAAGTTAVSSVTAVAPAGTVTARIYPFITGSGSAGNTVTVTKVSFHKGQGGLWAMPGEPIRGLTDAPLGNLLTLNQATGTDASGSVSEFYSYNGPTLSSVAGWDGKALQVVCPAAGGVEVYVSGSLKPGPNVNIDTLACSPGDTVTFTTEVKQTVGSRTFQAVLRFFDSAGSPLLMPGSPSGAVPTSTQRVATVTGVAPASTAYVRAVLVMGSGAANDTFQFDKLSLHRGAAGVYSLPGVPVVGQSRIAVNGAVDLSGTGSPEGVVTAAPGSTWLQTDATTDVKGWIKWIKATGTGNTGWVAGAEADTGWRNVSGSLNAAWALHAIAGVLTLRRVSNLVTLTGRLERVTASGSLNAWSDVYSTPNGFCPATATAGHVYGVLGNGWSTFTRSQVLMSNLNDSAVVEASIPGDAGTWAAGDDLIFQAQWITSDPWPSSLPGSAA